MVVCKAEQDGDFKMLFFNSDGGTAEMCGNGARCIARYGYEKGLSTGDTQRIETTSGLVIGTRRSERLYTVRLNDPVEIDLNRVCEVSGGSYECSYIVLGVPHAIFLMDNWEVIPTDELRKLGSQLRFYKGFPKGANVTFCRIVGEDKIKAVTFERGVEDFTLACGTGCGSVVTALTLRGLVSGSNVCVSMPGGDLFVTLNTDPVCDVYLTGPTNIVCEGEVMDEDLIY
jgi:diaminopimelate epimerase